MMNVLLSESGDAVRADTTCTRCPHLIGRTASDSTKKRARTHSAGPDRGTVHAPKRRMCRWPIIMQQGFAGNVKVLGARRGSDLPLTTGHFGTDGYRFEAISRESRAVSVAVGSHAVGSAPRT